MFQIALNLFFISCFFYICGQFYLKISKPLPMREFQVQAYRVCASCAFGPNFRHFTQRNYAFCACVSQLTGSGTRVKGSQEKPWQIWGALFKGRMFWTREWTQEAGAASVSATSIRGEIVCACLRGKNRSIAMNIQTSALSKGRTLRLSARCIIGWRMCGYICASSTSASPLKPRSKIWFAPLERQKPMRCYWLLVAYL